MKDYRKFITFIIFYAAGILWLDSIISCPWIIYGYRLPCTLFSTGTIIIIITLSYIAWDKALWKVKTLHLSLIGTLLGFHDFPNLNGDWDVSYESSYQYDDKNDKYVTFGKGHAKIEQTYEKIFINGIFGKSSKFESFASKLQQKENGKWFLVYSYRNKPIDIKLKSAPSGGSHEGFCYLEISKNGKVMKGYYSNDEERKTRGSIAFNKK